jgi:hypothetical protein
MGLLVLCHPQLRRLYNRVFSSTNSGHDSRSNGEHQRRKPSSDASNHLHQRASFDFWFALVFICALHGFSALKVVLLLYLNFCMAKRLPRRYVPAATWIFNIATLFANESCRGYKFASIAELISGRSELQKGTGSSLVGWGAWLDSYGGIMSRWEILFNITVLRLISFNLDYYWSLERRSGSPLEVSGPCCVRHVPCLRMLNRLRRSN